MTKTFDQSLIDTCIISMSMLDKDDIIQVGSEEYETLRREQQGCHNELTNREDYPFRLAKTTFTTQGGVSTYPSVKGRIKAVLYGSSKSELTFNNKGYLNQPASGTPTEFWEEYNPEQLVLYPTPAGTEQVTVMYYDSANVFDAEGNESYTITQNSTLKMPERLQHLYFDALEYYLLATHIKKDSNPRYAPTLKIFLEKWKVFIANCAPTTNSIGFVI